MAFLTKSQAARHFNVSPTTITNWISAAEKNKINLEIATVGSKTVIIDSEHNSELIKSLILKGKKHIGRSNRIFVDIKEDSELYNIFNKKQLAEIVSSISSRSEIPYKFSYCGKGADLWDKHYKFSLIDEKNFVNKEHKLIVSNLNNILDRFKPYKYINIIDFGCGNGLPTSPILTKLLHSEFQVTYTALDISQRMVDINKKELLIMFPDLQYTGKVMDFDRFNISDILMFNKHKGEAANLLLYLGGTLGNQNDISRTYANLRDSMGLDDFLLVSEGINSNFPKNIATQSNQFHLSRTTWILDLLGLKGSYSESVFNIFNSSKKETSRKIQISRDITVNLRIDSQNFQLNFNQGNEILVFSFYWYKEVEIIQQAVEHGFVIDQFNSNFDGTCALMMVRPKQISGNT